MTDPSGDSDTVWTELRLVLPRVRADSGAELMWELGATGVQEDLPEGAPRVFQQPWDTAPPPPSAEVLLRGWWEGDGQTALARLTGRVVDWEVAAPTAHPVSLQDWAETWKQGLTRVVVGDLAVAPPWLAEPGDLVVEPGMAFGTGEHPTTRRCLEGVQRLAKPGASCLDVGCGTGVLAIAAARLGMVATGIDIEADAVEASRDNARRNDVQASFSDTPLQRVQGRYALVVANLFAEVLVRLAPDLLRVVGGDLVLAGILVDREPAVVSALDALELVERQQDGEWVCLHLRAR